MGTSRRRPPEAPSSKVGSGKTRQNVQPKERLFLPFLCLFVAVEMKTRLSVNPQKLKSETSAVKHGEKRTEQTACVVGSEVRHATRTRFPETTHKEATYAVFVELMSVAHNREGALHPWLQPHPSLQPVAPWRPTKLHNNI